MTSLSEGTAGAKRVDGARRTEILDAAAQLFASSGYVGTSLKDVADQCGILAGSLYHHFESKESIAVELLERYQVDMDAVGAAALEGYSTPKPTEVFRRVSDLGAAVASCAVRNRAALQLTQYEPRRSASEALVAVAQRRSSTVVGAMRALLDDARASGYLKQNVDPATLSEQFSDAMLHVGSTIVHRNVAPGTIADVTARILLDGIAADPPSDTVLDRSPAMSAANRSLETWSMSGTDTEEDRFAVLQQVARVEFARRGYEATTVRHIAASANMGTGTVYRAIGSKLDLLDSIMNSFHVQLSRAYEAVLDTTSTALEKLDALAWVNLNALETFDKEFHIQRAWFRLTPPETSSVLGAIEERGRLLHAVLSEGRANGELRLDDLKIRQITSSVRDLMWMPTPLVERLGKPAAIAHARATILRGAAVRRYRHP
ncbi:TetR/AcrR family transcriptional regulator [Rhodococcus sp. P1Y]|uniref:TetR/AcrR family transcriptional regulator n=1 Tax=Rhodococcus sp. P1Y TaxID=1302308 RepID=UPI000EB2F075|nr:TetR/AcrR family transcriptional regulator [Rhodococcus sp. P1Y]AYJ50299.1 TetR/AcrR family transcriptional regulator [Rhodococcus sp. P1Y]